MPRLQHAPADAPKPPNTVEVVDPVWLLKAFGLTLLVAALFGYAAVCWYVSFGQWELVLHPTADLRATPASLQLPFESVHFGTVIDGKPAVSGWWVPATTPDAATALVCHAAAGNMSDALPIAGLLHAAGLNVLLFDPRGYGQSGGPHPTEQTMEADSRAALDYLTTTRHLPLQRIVPVGIGAGASLATLLATEHSALPALLLQDAKGDFRSAVQRETRSRLLPIGLLFNQDFPLAPPLTRLHTPKLLISYTAGPPPVEFAQAAPPRQTVELRPGAAETDLLPQLRAFLDNYLH